MAVGGSAEIDAMFQNARTGAFQMDAAVAQNCANAVQTLIQDLSAQRQRAGRSAITLPWTLESERQMHEGFLDKLDRLGSVLDEYLIAAEKLRLSFLTAGRILTEQDTEIADSLAQASRQLTEG